MTTNTKHTPGPWLATQEDAQTWVIESEDYGTITRLHDPYGASPLAANARLIAAAPVLVYVLTDALLASGYGTSRAAIPESERYKVPMWVYKARTLLARIDGEQA